MIGNLKGRRKNIYIGGVKKIFLNRIESLRNNLHILTFKHLFFSPFFFVIIIIIFHFASLWKILFFASMILH